MIHRLWKTLISLLLCASVLLCAAGSLADQIPDRVTAGARGCKLRSSPEAGNDKNLIINVHSGSTMEVLSVVGGWYLVRYLEYVGYVAANYVEITAFRAGGFSAATCRQLKPPQEMPIMPTLPFDQGCAVIQSITSMASESSRGVYSPSMTPSDSPLPRISTRTPAMPAAANAG